MKPSGASIARGLVPLLAGLLASTSAHAVERIRVSVEELTTGGIAIHDVQMELAIPSARHSVLEARAGEVELPANVRAQTGRLTMLHLRCEDPAVREPHFTCPAFTLDARAARLPPLHIEGDTRLDVDAGSMQVSGRGPTLAGAPLVFEFDGDAHDFAAHASLPSLEFAALAELIAPWYTLPSGLLPKGHAALGIEAGSRDGDASATVHADLTDVEYSNAEGTVVADKLRGQLRAQLHGLDPFETTLTLEATAGQLLAGPVYFDLASNPLHVDAHAARDGDALQLSQIGISQQDLAQLGGTARVRLDPLSVEAAQLELIELRFPAAYQSLLKIGLTTTPFADLTTSGRASGSVRIANDAPVAVDLTLSGVAFSDPRRQLDVRGVDADVHWAAGVTGPPRPSFVAWEATRGWGVTGGRTRIDFQVQDRDVRLTKPARLPLWDGALVVQELEARNIGSDRFNGSFDARIEPISLREITRAFGWPEFGGTVSGRIPGLTYQDGLLSVQGDVEAQAFDGTFTARKLQVRDPLGPHPQLHADVTARNLDLEQITRTFSFGNITGRLDGDLKDLQMYDGSPVVFDLRLATPDKDKSRHRISQKAVKNLANIGGGGGGVAAALQSGALRFFDTFRYERIGLSCRLQNDVCQMGGVEPAKSGYYIVKGSGLPRIDIIGNQSRVDWPLLVAQVSAALANTDEIRID